MFENAPQQDSKEELFRSLDAQLESLIEQYSTKLLAQAYLEGKNYLTFLKQSQQEVPTLSAAFFNEYLTEHLGWHIGDGTLERTPYHEVRKILRPQTEEEL